MVHNRRRQLMGPATAHRAGVELEETLQRIWPESGGGGGAAAAGGGGKPPDGPGRSKYIVPAEICVKLPSGFPDISKGIRRCEKCSEDLKT